MSDLSIDETGHACCHDEKNYRNGRVIHVDSIVTQCFENVGQRKWTENERLSCLLHFILSRLSIGLRYH